VRPDVTQGGAAQRSPPGFTVRTATVDDAAGVAETHVSTWRHAYRGLMPDETLDALDPVAATRMRRRHISEAGPGQYWLVAEDSGTVAGFVCCGPENEQGAAGGEIYALDGRPEHQGRVIGWALTDAAVARLHADGRRPVRLWVLGANARTRRWYERYGFVADGRTGVHTVERAGRPALDLPIVRYVLAG